MGCRHGFNSHIAQNIHWIQSIIEVLDHITLSIVGSIDTSDCFADIEGEDDPLWKRILH